MQIKRELYIELFEVYSELLTIKQRDVFQSYFFEDLTIDEMAQELSVSKAAISDSIKTTKLILENYESKIKALEMQKEINKLKGE